MDGWSFKPLNKLNCTVNYSVCSLVCLTVLSETLFAEQPVGFFLFPFLKEEKKKI